VFNRNIVYFYTLRFIHWTVSKYKKMKFLSLVLIMTLFINSKSLHQDRILKIDKKGNITGLPKEYMPAKFDKNKNLLRIKDKELELPVCINRFFNIHENPQLQLSASWYHSKEIMPYYLNFEIYQNNKDYTYNILIDLETLKLIYVDLSINEGNSSYFNRLEIDERCQKSYKENLHILK